jgi:(p)ppGpp synthase/HD superfamily hydrolase
MLYNAIQLAKEVHTGQVRNYTKEPFFHHPWRVMTTLSLRYNDTREAVLCAAILHDSVEDHPDKITIQGIRYCFGNEVVTIVQELTNTEDKSEIRSIRKRKNVQRLGNVSQEAKIIKLADRLDNIKSVLRYGEAGYVKLYIQETNDLLLAIEDGDPSLAQLIHDEILQYYANKAVIG